MKLLAEAECCGSSYFHVQIGAPCVCTLSLIVTGLSEPIPLLCSTRMGPGKTGISVTKDQCVEATAKLSGVHWRVIAVSLGAACFQPREDPTRRYNVGTRQQFVQIGSRTQRVEHGSFVRREQTVFFSTRPVARSRCGVGRAPGSPRIRLATEANCVWQCSTQGLVETTLRDGQRGIDRQAVDGPRRWWCCRSSAGCLSPVTHSTASAALLLARTMARR